MLLASVIATAAACVLSGQGWIGCLTVSAFERADVAGAQSTAPEFTGQSLDVVLTADSALAWDLDSGAILYEHNAWSRRPVASLTKLLSLLAVRQKLGSGEVIDISDEVRRAQRMGAHIKLPAGGRAQVNELLQASLVASANDAMVALAVAAAGSEKEFVDFANEYADRIGLTDTKIANSTGLSGGEQYSTAHDVRRLLMLVYEDKVLSPFFANQKGVLTTEEGVRLPYETTNKLLGSYLPVLAAKTGYTIEAKENLALITRDAAGHRIGTVILGSDSRFQDTKALVEWIWRNYTFEK